MTLSNTSIRYRRYEVQRRMAVFYAACSLSGAFGGLLAFAIAKMDGIAGLHGWKWIFILEGLATVCLAIPVWWLLPSSPATAKFLTPAERQFVTNRLKSDTGGAGGETTNDDKMSFQHIKAAFKEVKIYILMIIYTSVSVGVYGFTATVPTVVNDLGYTSSQAQLMTIPVRYPSDYPLRSA